MWSGWNNLGGINLTNLAPSINLDGRLEVFASGTDYALNHTWQNPATAGGGWSAWAGLGGAITKMAVARNEDGRLEVFAIGTNGALNHIWQTAAGGGWSAWAGLGGNITEVNKAV